MVFYTVTVLNIYNMSLISNMQYEYVSSCSMLVVLNGSILHVLFFGLTKGPFFEIMFFF